MSKNSTRLSFVKRHIRSKGLRWSEVKLCLPPWWNDSLWDTEGGMGYYHGCFIISREYGELDFRYLLGIMLKDFTGEENK